MSVAVAQPSSLAIYCAIIGYMSDTLTSEPGAGTMLLTEEKTRLALIIDTHVREVLAQGGGDEALLISMADDMGTFKQLLDTCTGAEMDALCERYDGFYRFAKLLEMLAGGIADGSIPVPE